MTASDAHVRRKLHRAAACYEFTAQAIARIHTSINIQHTQNVVSSVICTSIQMLYYRQHLRMKYSKQLKNYFLFVSLDVTLILRWDACHYWKANSLSELQSRHSIFGLSDFPRFCTVTANKLYREGYRLSSIKILHYLVITTYYY
jgi:hypothetical protein